MQPIVASFNEVNLYAYSFVVTLAFLWGGFVFYKRATESHFEEEKALDVVVLSGFFSLIIGRTIYAIENYWLFWGNLVRVILLKNYPGISPWGILLGVWLTLYLILGKEKKKLVDLLDHALVGIVSAMSVMLAGFVIINFSIILLVVWFFTFLFFLMLWKMESEYRTFEWYRYKRNQAKSGLISGLGISYFASIVMALGLLSRSLNWLTALVSLMVFVGGFVLLYIRSGRVFADDIKIILKHDRKK